ncbi:GTPase HflX [Lutibaculum baratangense]|uniref:GTPase HflX n=1 Tax=Lutibaculum baratangense AMV1 TaxID=631454 RepID=V4TN97_9HYPH|nr:GTPase HflX [Lutibaculum baratangense]ESR27198.1 GTP-binding protein HflX [Lutibaculum baratangense AMV1]
MKPRDSDVHDPAEGEVEPRPVTEETKQKPTRTLVLVPVLERGAAASGPAVNARSPDARLEEACGLAEAIALEVVDRGTVRVTQVRPATLIGTGKVDEIAGSIKAQEIELVVVDHPLSPVQQRNLERAWKAKVLDRTGLILEIFGERARTKEGRLQVELAHLNWQKSRLVRSWTHLERQRGGFGFLGGPGETQIEADRRIIQDRIRRIEADLKDVQRTRGLHRESRRRVPYPVLALVGYTNAGKSTLFNRLTKADVMAENLLFATLDPTLREIKLPTGRPAILSDTVGFISDLPTHLVAAFRATLEEVIEADVVVHVRDISHPDSETQAKDVMNVLKALGVDVEDEKHIIEVYNKIDLLSPEAREALLARRERESLEGIPVSAVTGEGIDQLLATISERLGKEEILRRIRLAGTRGQDLNWLYERCEVVERVDDPETGETAVTIRVPPQRLPEFERRFGALVEG